VSSVLILGATSGIGRAVTAEFASRGYDLILAGRNRDELAAIAADASVRYSVATSVLHLDALDFESHEAVLGPCLVEAGDALAGVVLFFGYLGDQTAAQTDFAEARRIIDTNYTACVSILNIIANHFEKRRSGFICAVSSVAGDRGRQSNYLYGSAKGALSLYLQGLRNRLHGANVRVITIKPGFVDTPMTFGRPGLFLVASPKSVAKGIYRAVAKGTDVAYVPWFWWPIMLAIRSVPERVFKRMRL
jgi:short-subunit dehydrogenase